MNPLASVFFLSVCCLFGAIESRLVEPKVDGLQVNNTVIVLPTHEDCLLPIERGICYTVFHAAVLFPRFAYDVRTRNCVRFYYNGCSSNANNFETKEKCVEKCINYKKNSGPVVEHKVAEGKTEVITKTKRPTHEDCLLPIKSGICYTVFHSAVVFPRFGYDMLRRKCVRFYHTGCVGNANNFETREECVEKCIEEKGNSAPVGEHKVVAGKTEDTTKTKRPIHADCLLAPIVGICTATSHLFPSAATFSYIANRNECAAVLNVGCLHNANSFKSPEDCISKCMN